MPEKRRYEGSCHCGKVRFAFNSEPITKGYRCNCSICKRKGAVMSMEYIPKAEFHPHWILEDFGDYRFGEWNTNHLFCLNCGIYPYDGDFKRGYRVNLGCVEDIDIFDLDVTLVDGKSL